jgi:predicted TIM-barrel fold metal-dependent hydrolase
MGINAIREWLKKALGRNAAAPGRFDAHCHVFNLEYLLLEAGQMLWDAIIGRYPEAAPGTIHEDLAFERSGAERLGGIETFIRWAVQLLGAALSSETENARFLRKAADEAWGEKDLGLVPLMMDIYYMYAPPLREGASLAAAAPGGETAPSEAQRQEFKRRYGAIVEAQGTRLAARARGSIAAGILSGGALPLADEILARIEASSPQGLRSGLGADFKQTAGFRHQMEALDEVRRALPGKVFPFLAVDPRRRGIVQALLAGGLVGGDGPYYGVKLYPRLGVHPACKELEPVYDYCSKKKIPITSHCSRGGFPDWMDTWALYGQPSNFRPALRGRPDLRIDLAHFGDRSDGFAWADEIKAMMAEFPGVYSDLACYTRKSVLDAWFERYGADALVAKRTMYGSDFDVMYFTNPGEVTLQGYGSMFKDRFGDERLKAMSGQVVKEFLGIA